MKITLLALIRHLPDNISFQSRYSQGTLRTFTSWRWFSSLLTCSFAHLAPGMLGCCTRFAGFSFPTLHNFFERIFMGVSHFHGQMVNRMSIFLATFLFLSPSCLYNQWFSLQKHSLCHPILI